MTTPVYGNESQGISSINAPDNSIIIDPTGDVNIASIIVTGGTLDGVVIGGVTPAAGSFTTLYASGNVGIGTTNPTQKLAVQEDLNAITIVSVSNAVATGNVNAGARFALSCNGNSGYLGVHPSDYNWGLLADRMVMSVDSNSAGITLLAPGATQDIRFFAGSSNESMRIDSSGNVNIGLTAAAASSAGVITLGNGTTPTANVSGGTIYVSGGALYYRGSSGTVTTLGVA